jgi:hypothetical protein
LSEARGRIKKQKNRVLSLPSAPGPQDLAHLVREGLRSCHRGLAGTDGGHSQSNFTLEAFRAWAVRMHGSKDKNRWEHVFAPGPRFWKGLTYVHDYIEHHGSGGGLCRPIFADFLSEAAGALGKPALHSLSDRYAELGRGWSELAAAALPDDVPAFREARELLARRSELMLGGDPSAPDGIRDCWKRLAQLEAGTREQFPLSDGECADLRADLQRRITALYEGERAAHTAIGEVLAAL